MLGLTCTLSFRLIRAQLLEGDFTLNMRLLQVRTKISGVWRRWKNSLNGRFSSCEMFGYDRGSLEDSYQPPADHNETICLENLNTFSKLHGVV